MTMKKIANNVLSYKQLFAHAFSINPGSVMKLVRL